MARSCTTRCRAGRAGLALQTRRKALMQKPLVAALALLVVTGACARQEPENTRAAAQAAPAPSGDWPMYGGPLSGDRYSPLAQITAANVGQLRQVCAFDAPDVVNFQSGIV